MDWDTFELEDSNHWSLYYDSNLGYGQNFIAFLNRSIALKNESVYSPVIASYAICNSKATKTMPILFVTGSSGTGKSLIGYLIAAFRESHDNIIGSSTTFAGIRNQLQHCRWHDHTTPLNTALSNEKPYLMVWADIKESSFKGQDDKMYSLFRNGCYRSEEKIYISSGDGSNIPFYVYGQKIVSSIENFFLKPQWSELHRRCLFVKTLHFDALDPDYIAEFNTREYLDPTTISWKNIEVKFLEHWTQDRLKHIQSCYKSKNRMIKSLTNQYGLSAHQAAISFDLIVAGYVSDLFDNLDHCMTIWGDYWRFIVSEINEVIKPVLQQVLEQVISTHTNYQVQQNQKLITLGREDLIEPPTIDPKIIKQSLEQAKNDGVLLFYRNTEVTETMSLLGFEICRQAKGFVWKKIS